MKQSHDKIIVWLDLSQEEERESMDPFHIRDWNVFQEEVKKRIKEKMEVNIE